MKYNIGKLSFSEKQIETATSRGYQDTYWDDLRAPAAGINPAGQVSPPTVNSADGSLVFNTGNAVCIWFQMPHAWKVGTDIEPHVHWTKSTSAAGIVNWQIKYKIANIGDTFPAFTSLTTGELVINDNNTAGTHALTRFQEIPGYGKRISTMICIYLERVASGDTYGASVNLLEFDLHYQVDGFGSEQEFIKATNK